MVADHLYLPLIEKMVRYRCTHDFNIEKKNFSRHVACVFIPKKDHPILSIGINYVSSDRVRTCHAEDDAILKLPRSKKPIGVCLLVIRISRSFSIDTLNDDLDVRLLNSKPCICCLFKMKSIFEKGYNLNRVYYSDSVGSIECSKLEDLLKTEPAMSSLDHKIYDFDGHGLPREVKKFFNL